MGQDLKITPVILSGGAGTRLWPLSGAAAPKQFHALTGERTMLQMTAARLGDDVAPPIVVANAAHADLVEAQLGAVGLLILEPCARNTAPAIALAACAVDPDALLLVMPSDHVVADVAAFRAAIAAAAPLAADGWLVTFGIRPAYAETGYGYIRRGKPIADGVFAVAQFVEKPDLATAQAYVGSGDHDWNGGIFLLQAGALLESLASLAPPIAAAALAAIDGARREGVRLWPEPRAFAGSPAQSIDYAVMEKAERVAVVPVAMGWSDVGSWDALYALGPHDAAGNLLRGDVRALGGGNNLIRSDGPAVVAIGVDDLIVVAANNQVLIVPRGDSQQVRRAADALRDRG